MVEKINTETIHSQGVSKGIISFLPISQSPEMSKIPKIVCLPKIRCSNEVDEFSSSNRSSVTLISHCNLTIDSWAEVEFRHANLGDVRRQKRLIQLAEKRGAAPNASIPQACGDTASTKAAYRFYDNQAVTEEDILGSHQKATQERMAIKVEDFFLNLLITHVSKNPIKRFQLLSEIAFSQTQYLQELRA